MVCRLPLMYKSLVEQLCRSFHQYQIPVSATVGSDLHQILYSLHILTLRLLIAVRPEFPCDVLTVEYGDVRSME